MQLACIVLTSVAPAIAQPRRRSLYPVQSIQSQASIDVIRSRVCGGAREADSCWRSWGGVARQARRLTHGMCSLVDGDLNHVFEVGSFTNTISYRILCFRLNYLAPLDRKHAGHRPILRTPPRRRISPRITTLGSPDRGDTTVSNAGAGRVSASTAKRGS